MLQTLQSAVKTPDMCSRHCIVLNGTCSITALRCSINHEQVSEQAKFKVSKSDVPSQIFPETGTSRQSPVADLR